MFNQAAIIGDYQSMGTNDQIRYLQEENQFLKELISQARSEDSTNHQQQSKTRTDCLEHGNDATACKCTSTKYRALLHTYENFLDSLTMQLLNSLQMQESIRFQLSNISQNSKNENSHIQLKKQVATTQSLNSASCRTCSETVEVVRNPRNMQNALKSNNNNARNQRFDEGLESVYKFQALLDEQQNQQLKMLNDLCLISKLVKVQATEENSRRNNSPPLTRRLRRLQNFKSASSYISFTTDLYEANSCKRCLSLSQINVLELSPSNETVTSNLHVFLGNQVSKMDLIEFGNNLNAAQLLLADYGTERHDNKNNSNNADELKNLVFDTKSTTTTTKSDEVDATSHVNVNQGCNFTDSILKEIKEQYDRPVFLNVAGDAKDANNNYIVEQTFSKPDKEPISTNLPKPVTDTNPSHNKKNQPISLIKAQNYHQEIQVPGTPKKVAIQSKIPKLNTYRKPTEPVKKVPEPSRATSTITTTISTTRNTVNSTLNNNRIDKATHITKENSKQAVKPKNTTTTSDKTTSLANSSSSMTKKPKTLKPTVFNQPHKPPLTPSPVKKLRNPPRITFIKPVQKVVVVPPPQNKNLVVVNSNTFHKESSASESAPVLRSPTNQLTTNKTSTKRSSIYHLITDKPTHLSKKRFCFPNLKSSSPYANNQFFSQYAESLEHKTQSQNNLASSKFKFLSESDIHSLQNRLSPTYDKDLSNNVYHLDTLYNNIDYILFNTYASDTELSYDTNRQHNERIKRFITSSYKLFINDYFNKTYPLESSEDEETSNEVEDTDVIVEEDETETDEIVLDVDGTDNSDDDGEDDDIGRSQEMRYSLEEYNQAYSMPELHVNVDDEFIHRQGNSGSNDEIIEFEFGEYEIEDPELQHVDYCMDYSDIDEQKLDEYRMDDDDDDNLLVFDCDFDDDHEHSPVNKNFYTTESSTFNDVYLQITDDQNMDTFLVQVKSPRFSIASLTTLSKSYIDEFHGGIEMSTNIHNSSLTSSLDSSSRSSSLKYTGAKGYHTTGKQRKMNNVFDELSVQNFDIDDFMKDVNRHSSFMSGNSSELQNSSNGKSITTPTNLRTALISRRHSINFEYELQAMEQRPMAYSKSEIQPGYILNPFACSFSELFKAPKDHSKIENRVNGDETIQETILIDNLCNNNNDNKQVEHGTPVKINNKFNTDFYKLCSDTFLNESNYALTHPHQNTNGQHSQSLSVDRFHISYQV